MGVEINLKASRRFICVLVTAFCLLAMEAISSEPDKAVPVIDDSMIGEEAGQVRDDNGLQMKFVWCPPGFLRMEQTETPGVSYNSDINRVKVFLSRGYWIGQYETTQGEWKRVMLTEPWKDKEFTKEGPEFPATYVNWDDAMEFSRKLTQQERNAGRLSAGWEYSLPTEAQWERACRAGTDTKFSFGDDESKLGEYAWFDENTEKVGQKYPHMVGQKKPNPWGLYDMHGNATEWCRDFYRQRLPGGRDPEVVEPTERSFRVVRGGLWILGYNWCRSGIRCPGPAPANLARVHNLGFRVVLTPIRQSQETPGSADK